MRCSPWVKERDLLLTNYTELSEETELLRTNYTNLVKECDQVRRMLNASGESLIYS